MHGPAVRARSSGLASVEVATTILSALPERRHDGVGEPVGLQEFAPLRRARAIGVKDTPDRVNRRAHLLDARSIRREAEGLDQRAHDLLAVEDAVAVTTARGRIPVCGARFDFDRDRPLGEPASKATKEGSRDGTGRRGFGGSSPADDAQSNQPWRLEPMSGALKPAGWLVAAKS